MLPPIRNQNSKSPCYFVTDKTMNDGWSVLGYSSRPLLLWSLSGLDARILLPVLMCLLCHGTDCAGNFLHSDGFTKLGVVLHDDSVVQLDEPTTAGSGSIQCFYYCYDCPTICPIFGILVDAIYRLSNRSQWISARFMNAPLALNIGHSIQTGRIPRQTSIIAKALESFRFAK
jgi:hypothetical protein